MSDRLMNVCLLRSAALSTMLAALIASAASCAAPYETNDEEEESASTSSAWTDPNDPSWDCYAAEPGHPTPAEKSRFFTDRVAAAQEAETTYGVPAAAMLAMTAQEGGFGFTRIALYAFNEFGYKFTSTSSAGGRGSYTLACQPEWDVGKDYIKFSSPRDGILFVARKLATRADWANYKAATDRYRNARRAGANVAAAVDEWFDGIADAGYNYDPPTYKRSLKTMARTFDLYRYSASTSPGGASTPSTPSTPSSTSGWVSVESPAEGAGVAGSVPLRASASSSVSKVTFTSISASGAEYVIGSKGAPFDMDWATAGYVPNGTYSIRFDAYSGSTKVASTTRRVYVGN